MHHQLFTPLKLSLCGILTLQQAVTFALAAATPPSDFTANPNVGPGNTNTKFKDSPHFRVYNAPNDNTATTTLNTLESAYTCFVTDLGWRSTGLSFRQAQENDSDYNGPYYKLNVYTVSTLPGAAANTGTDMTLGLSFLNVLPQYLPETSVTVHEFGHALTYSARYWIDQGRTGAWWETIANFVADTFITSSVCASARSKYSQSNQGNTLIDLGKVIGDSHQVIVDATKDTGNYYQAWPFLVYLFNNPDNFTGLGHSIFPNMWTKYKRNSNETPLHVLDRLVSSSGVKIQQVVSRYWARMAFVDIGHPKAQAQFTTQRAKLSYANLDAQGGGRYRVKAARQPKYMGANIIPLKGASGTVGVNLTVTGGMGYMATLAVKGGGGAVRYVGLEKGSGQVVVAAGEEVALVVVNVPDGLVLYDPFSLTAEVKRGLDYQVVITGASV